MALAWQFVGALTRNVERSKMASPEYSHFGPIQQALRRAEHSDFTTIF